jgi:hypothetical protein
MQVEMGLVDADYEDGSTHYWDDGLNREGSHGKCKSTGIERRPQNAPSRKSIVPTVLIGAFPGTEISAGAFLK